MPPPPHKTLRRPFDYPYRPSDSVLKNPPGCCKNGHQRYYSSTCTLSQCSVSSHFYTGGNDMKDITISRRSLLVSAGLLALARSPDAAATLVPALLPPVPTTPSAFCNSPSTPHSMPPTTALSRPSRRAALRSRSTRRTPRTTSPRVSPLPTSLWATTST